MNLLEIGGLFHACEQAWMPIYMGSATTGVVSRCRPINDNDSTCRGLNKDKPGYLRLWDYIILKENIDFSFIV